MPIPPSLSGWRTIASSVVRTFISLPAGIARMNQVRFHIYTFIGSWPWCYVLAYRHKVGRQVEYRPRFKDIFHRFHLGVEVVIIAAFVWLRVSHSENRIAWNRLSLRRVHAVASAMEVNGDATSSSLWTSN